MSRADGPRPRGSNYHGVTTQPSLEARSFYSRDKRRNANNSVAGPCVLRLRVYSITLFASSLVVCGCSGTSRFIALMRVDVLRRCYTRGSTQQARHGYLAYGTSSCPRSVETRERTALSPRGSTDGTVHCMVSMRRLSRTVWTRVCTQDSGELSAYPVNSVVDIVLSA